MQDIDCSSNIQPDSETRIEVEELECDRTKYFTAALN